MSDERRNLSIQETTMSDGPWTHFWDMNSGGGQKLEWKHIFIEAPVDEAKSVFYARFGRSPDRVSCTCCGEDYSVSEYPSLAQASGHERSCNTLDTPRVDGRYRQPDDQWWRDHYYIEPEDEAEARERGWTVEESMYRSFRPYQSVEEFIENDDVLVIYAHSIHADERTRDVPEEGYQWVG